MIKNKLLKVLLTAQNKAMYDFLSNQFNHRNVQVEMNFFFVMQKPYYFIILNKDRLNFL